MKTIKYAIVFPVVCFILFVLPITLRASAQDRPLTILEAGCDWVKVEITRPSPDDGGCLFSVYGSNDAGIDVVPGVYSFNGARCATVQTAALKAAKKDLGVGSGAIP